ncbi:3733_t:CDS:2 [Paraglomus occultum]|uniref:3733_t:CDS:1 n=1 Tax=Paraglomus occultum TaxID=144539 RepID=A0A9N9B9K8_9GLOM|nr:3733_t:CDS:2 [Paraglomus occultum]
MSYEPKEYPVQQAVYTPQPGMSIPQAQPQAVPKSQGGYNCCLRIMTRGDIRARKGINGSCMGDCCTHFCCGCCALIQERREFDD